MPYPLLVIGVYSLIAQGWRNLADKLWNGALKDRVAWFVTQNEWFFNRMTLLAMTIAALIYLLPFAASLLVTNSNLGLFMVLRENVLRFVEPFDHEAPIYLYAYTIFVLTAPWCLFLPAALVQAHSKPRREERSLRPGLLLGDIYFFHSLGLQARLLLAAHFTRGGHIGRAVVCFNAGKLGTGGCAGWLEEAMSSALRLYF